MRTSRFWTAVAARAFAEACSAVRGDVGRTAIAVLVVTTAGLYAIGEVLDVTGHLGGFNFQWAWASGVAAGEDV